MKFIQKSDKNEPASLLKERKTIGGSYADLKNREEVRNALLNEQGYICAYCNQRIENNLDDLGRPIGVPNMKIEHWEAQNSENELIWNNLLGVCKGNEGKPKKLQHCDTRKGNTPIQISPLNSKVETLVQYDLQGKVFSENEDYNRDLNETLNLNHQTIVENRMVILDEVKSSLKNQLRTKSAKKAFLKRERAKWASKTAGKHIPFCMIAISYLDKKLSRI